MNKERILELAGLLESGRFQTEDGTIGFDMGTWVEGEMAGEDWKFTVDSEGKECGTVACLAGWAVARFGDLKEANEQGDIQGIGAEVLELEARQEDNLFLPNSYLYPWAWKAKPQEAAKVLRHLAETGEVDWTIVQPLADAAGSNHG